MVEATQSYRERIKAQRGEARAKRLAEEGAWRRRIWINAEVNRLALEATKQAIRDRGEKVTHYKASQLRVMANEMIGPWLVAQAKARIAERNSKHLSRTELPAWRGFLLNETHAHKGSGLGA